MLQLVNLEQPGSSENEKKERRGKKSFLALIFTALKTRSLPAENVLS